MKNFHQRYMCSQKACGLWANMIRGLDVKMTVPQHGRRFEGENITKFLDWIVELPCGIDLLTQSDYDISQIQRTQSGLSGL